MTTTDIKTKTKAAAKLVAAAARAERALATPPARQRATEAPKPFDHRRQRAEVAAEQAIAAGAYLDGQPGLRAVLPMLLELQEMRAEMVTDWVPWDWRSRMRADHALTEAEAKRRQAASYDAVRLRVEAFERAIGGIEDLLRLGEPNL